MRIKFQPTQTNWPADKRVHTNLGEFLPGEERLLNPEQETEGLRLIANGEFVNPDAAEAPAPAVVTNAEEALSGQAEPKKSKK